MIYLEYLKMYNDNIIFHSDRNYPSIESSGKTTFNISSAQSIDVVDASSSSRYLVFIESGGYRYLASNAYIDGGKIKVFIDPDGTMTGTIYWRKYVD